jgi:hypothetical protein
VNTVDFDLDKSYFKYDGVDNQSVFLMYEYLNVLGTGDIIGRRPTNVTVSHFIGNDSQEWTSTADTYAAVRYRDLWHEIDLRWVAQGGVSNGMKADFILTASDANATDIAVEISGATSLILSEDKQTLNITTACGDIIQELYIYNKLTEEEVSGNFTVDGNIFGYEIDPAAEWTRLVIDPLIYSTFLGGTSSDDRGSDIWMDQDSGDVVVTGTAGSSDFPSTPGAYNTSSNGGQDIFVVRLAANGSNLIFGTFIGGSGTDNGVAVELDDAGRVYVTAGTSSADFPTTSGVFNATNGANGDVAVFRLSENGSFLEWSGVFGGSGWDNVRDLVLDNTTSDVVVAGFSQSNNISVTAGAYSTTLSGSTDGFVARIRSDGSQLLNCTYIGSTGVDDLMSVRVNSTGYVYVSGYTEGNDWPATFDGYQNVSGGSRDVVCAILSGNLSVLHTATYVGGAGNDYGGWMAMSDERVALVAETSGSWPVTSGAYDESYAGGTHDAGITILDSRLNVLENSTYLGGSDNDVPARITMDSDGNVYVCGRTYSNDFPVHEWAFQNTYVGSLVDAFASKLTYDLANLSYSTYLTATGSGSDLAVGIAVRDSDDVWERDIYVVGHTDGSTFPTTSGAFDESANGGYDVFVVGIEHPDPRPLIRDVIYSSTIEYHQNWTLFANVTALGIVTDVEMRFNASSFAMNNSATPEVWNYTTSIHTMNPGTNTFRIYAASDGNTTFSSYYTFACGYIPQFSSFSGSSTVATVTDWQTTVRVTDSTDGDSGVASVWIQFDEHKDGWRQMTADGDVYTSPVYVFGDEGEELWQVRAYDNVGNVAYSSKTRLTVGGEASIASTSSTLTVLVEEDPWVPTPVSSASWWIYVAVFATLVLGFALSAAPRVPNGELIMTLLVAAGASAMVMAYLSAVVGVLDPTTMAVVWLGLLGWAWLTSRGGPTGLLLGGTVLCIGLAVQALLAGAILEWLTWAYVLGGAASASGALSIETGNAYLVLATVILSVVAVVFGIIFIFV